MKLILIRGLPGSGKSTLAEEIDGRHIEADQYWMVSGQYIFDANKLHQAHNWCQMECLHHLQRHHDVVVSNTFTTKKELKPYFEIAKQFNIVPIVIHCQNNFGNIHNVPEETLKKMRQRWQYDISELFEDIN